MGRLMGIKLIRDFEAGEHLDLFLVTAVTTVLLIRLFLKLTVFPNWAAIRSTWHTYCGAAC